MEVLGGYIVIILIGGAIGATRGRTAAGILFATLLGPLGWLIILIGPNYVKQKKEKEEKEKTERMFKQQIEMQRKQLEAMQKVGAGSAAQRKLRIAKDGEEIGEFDTAKVKLMLKSANLCPEDLYFDEETQDWYPLECHPHIF